MSTLKNKKPRKISWQTKKLSLISIFWVLILSAIAFIGNTSSVAETASNFSVNSLCGDINCNISTEINKDTVEQIAKQITVRIFTENKGEGSGVIIARQGQIYTVLTCEHILFESKDNKYNILTADGQIHQGERQRSPKFTNLDLALVEFTSDRIYVVSQIGNSEKINVGDIVYAAGFPNSHSINSGAIESTRNWGLKAFRFTTGNLGMVSERSLLGGYQLGYSNDIEQGMSGGPLLDINAQLIGINGRFKNPLKGILVFTFTDGTKPSPELFEKMKSFSWAIPIATFQKYRQH